MLDVLQLIWLEFPELQKVIRTNHLPLSLALRPTELAAWLSVMRKIGLSLEAFPHVLSEVYESLGSDLSIALFEDGGPPMIGSSEWIHSTFSADQDCGFGDDCECYPKCGTSPQPRLILDIPPDVSVLSLTPETAFRKFLSSLGSPILENALDNGCTLRYVYADCGRILCSKEKETKSSVHDTATQVSDNQSVSAITSLTLEEYLKSFCSETLDSVDDSLFYPPLDDGTATEASLMPESSDGDTTLEIAWKRRPNIPGAQPGVPRPV